VSQIYIIAGFYNDQKEILMLKNVKNAFVLKSALSSSTVE